MRWTAGWPDDSWDGLVVEVVNYEEQAKRARDCSHGMGDETSCASDHWAGSEVQEIASIV